jgi:uncharacterized membrane protein YfcA
VALPLAAAAAAVLVGLALGLLGGGGSILSVPVLHYLVGLPMGQAAPVALLVVGTTASVALLGHARAGNVRWRAGITFAASAMAGGFAGGRLARHLPDRVLLVLFGAVALAAAVAMLRPRVEPATPPLPHSGTVHLALGVGTGLVTSLVGAGGGFLIVPVLSTWGGLPLRDAVGTSLLVIAANALAGFAGHGTHQAIPWAVALPYAAATLAGTVVGLGLAPRVAVASLRRGFGALVLVVAVVVLGRESF